MAQSEFDWSPIAVQLLLAIAERTRDCKPISYAPASWLQLPPSPKNRSRWSRWTRRLANAGLVQRLTEPNRDRVRRVAITPAGLEWIERMCGPGALWELSCEWELNNTERKAKQNG